MISTTTFFLLLGLLGIIGGMIALKIADYEKRKKHGM